MNDQEKLCHGKDVFERMNFLYQANQLISKVDKVAASNFGDIMLSCSKKAVLRIEPEIKRSICKGCHIALIPGENAKVRLVSKPIKAVKWTCLSCQETRRIPTKKGYKLWIDHKDSIVKLYNYSKPTSNSKKKIENINKESTQKS